MYTKTELLTDWIGQVDVWRQLRHKAGGRTFQPRNSISWSRVLCISYCKKRLLNFCSFVSVHLNDTEGDLQLLITQSVHVTIRFMLVEVADRRRNRLGETSTCLVRFHLMVKKPRTTRPSPSCDSERNSTTKLEYNAKASSYLHFVPYLGAYIQCGGLTYMELTAHNLSHNHDYGLTFALLFFSLFRFRKE
jgi:hypothetical protein